MQYHESHTQSRCDDSSHVISSPMDREDQHLRDTRLEKKHLDLNTSPDVQRMSNGTFSFSLICILSIDPLFPVKVSFRLCDHRLYCPILWCMTWYCVYLDGTFDYFRSKESSPRISYSVIIVTPSSSFSIKRVLKNTFLLSHLIHEP